MEMLQLLTPMHATFGLKWAKGIYRGANLEEAEIVVGCQQLIRGIRGMEKVGVAPSSAISSRIFVLSKQYYIRDT